MKKLFILYDANCQFCRRCRNWMEAQPAFLEISFVPARSAEAQCRFPGIEKYEANNELTVISDEGGVYQGSNAFIMCLYALTDFREWSLRLSRPALLPFARQMFDFISNNRVGFSKWFRASNDEQLAGALENFPQTLCGNTNMSCLKTARQNAASPR